MPPIRSSAHASCARRWFCSALVLCALLCATDPAHADDGDPDPAFSLDGTTWHRWSTTYQGADIFDVTTRSVTVTANGSVATVGGFSVGGDDRFDACVVTRWDSSGAIDDGFGTDGWMLVYFESQPNKDDCLGIFPAPGNTLLVVGAVESMSPPYEKPALVRLLPNGALDPGFGVGGKVVIDSQPFAGAGYLFKGAIQAPDGKILLFGACEDCGHGSFDDFTAVRINANGSVDTSFGNAGWVSFGRTDQNDHYLPERATAAAIDSRGRIVLAGYTENYDDQDHQQRPLIVRYKSDGTLDTQFNLSGWQEINVVGSFAPSAVAIDPVNDTIVLAANITHTSSVLPGAMLTRVREYGMVDTNFGSGGFVTLQYEEGTNIAALGVRRDRRIVAAGWIDPNGVDTRDYFAARLVPSGALDGSFDGNGVNRYTFTFADESIDEPAAMAISDGRPVIAGQLVNEATNPERYGTGVLRLQSDALFADGLD